MTTRRQFAVQLTGLAALSTGIFSAAAQSQPTPELARLLVGFPPGGSTDNVARRLAERLRGTYAANVLVENKPGAGTQIAVSALKDATPDGNTLLLSPPAPFSVYPHTYSKLPYAVEDVLPTSMVCTFPFALAVGPAVPNSVRTLQDFVAWAKANPGKSNFGSPASGSTPHLVGSVLGKLAGIDFTHIAYLGDAPGLQDLMGGQVDCGFLAAPTVLPQIQSGRVTALATTGRTRSPLLPALPTIAESGYPDFDGTYWLLLAAPKGVPAEIQKRFLAAMDDAIRSPLQQERVKAVDIERVGSSPEQAQARVREISAKWEALARKINLKPD